MKHNDFFKHETKLKDLGPIKKSTINDNLNTTIDHLCSDKDDSAIVISSIIGIIALIFLMGFGSCFVDSAVTLSSNHLWAIVPTVMFATIFVVCYKVLRCSIKKISQHKK